MLFKGAAGMAVLRYGELSVTDAVGKRLDAGLHVLVGRIQIRINDQGAVYPLTVDPLLTTPVWIAESDQAGADFGIAVASAGDVNGDRYGDVIVGAHLFDNGQADEGRVFVYLGSASGLGATPAWTAESDQGNAQLGAFVATAGDVNLDGYSDILVGAYLYDNGQADEGAAFVWLGGPGGLGANGDPSNADWMAESNQTQATASLGLLGRADSPAGFRVRARGRTAAGRGRVRLEIEAKPFGTPFDGRGFLGASFDSGAPTASGSSVALSEPVGPLATDTVYHWRVRVRSTSAFFPSTPWFVVPGNGPREADLRTGCLDLDGDGFRGNAACSGAGPVDCDDTRAEVYPGAPQLCDGINDDCSDPSWPAPPAAEADLDSDGFRFCAGDCDDADATVYSGAAQLCDGINNNCSDPTWPATPANELDLDGDGSIACADCNDANILAWRRPSDVTGLTLSPDRVTITWTAPADLGATSVLYDTIKNTDPDDFVVGAACIESNGSDTVSIDPVLPDVGDIIYYLVAVENACPAPGNRNTGTDSTGAPIAARACP